MSNTNRIVTLGVLADAYKGKRASLKIMLTHSVDVALSEHRGYWQSLCGNENMADEFSSDEESQALAPTCPRCLKKDPRF